jgi:hypothetical protein
MLAAALTHGIGSRTDGEAGDSYSRIRRTMAICTHKLSGNLVLPRVIPS